MVPELASIRTYDEFLRVAIHRYARDQGASRITLIAFLLATREAWAVAWDETTSRAVARPVLAGAAGLATLGVLIRILAGGRFGRALAGASLASLVVVHAVERDRIRRKRAAIEQLVGGFRVEFDALRDERDGRAMRAAQWELVMNGLVRRFLEALEEAPLGFADPSAAAGYREYVVGPTDRPPAG